MGRVLARRGAGVEKDAIVRIENEGFAARMRGTKKTENPHLVDPNPTFVSLLKPQDRAAMAEAWEAGWRRAHESTTPSKA
jgi:hypothetical protein